MGTNSPRSGVNCIKDYTLSPSIINITNIRTIHTIVLNDSSETKPQYGVFKCMQETACRPYTGLIISVKCVHKLI